MKHRIPRRGVKSISLGSRFPAQTLLLEVGAAARECGNSLGTPGTLSYEAPGSLNPKLCRSRHSSCDPSACKYGVTTCDQGKFTLQRVDSVCSVYPAASAGCGQRFGRAPGGEPYPLSLVEATPSESSEANQDSPSPLASHLLEVPSPFLG